MMSKELYNMGSSFKPVRRAHLISPFGVGAMVNFPNDETLMTAGLDMWTDANAECPSDWHVKEERLQKRLGVSHFRLPPDYREKEKDPAYLRRNIPFIRFPRWHYCSDRTCGRMEELSLYSGGIARCRSDKHAHLPEYRKPKLIPVRFIAVCPKGHIEDFPFFQWVHTGGEHSDNSHIMSYKAGRSAALSGITIECSCGKKRTMAGAFSYNVEDGGPISKIGHLCNGLQPWLGVSENNAEGCGEHLRAVQRGGSNVYFPHTFSSIYLPLWAEGRGSKIIKVLESQSHWSTLTDGLIEGSQIDPARASVIADLFKVDSAELLETAQKKLDGEELEVTETEEQYRFSEYQAFQDARGDPDSDLFVESINIEGYEEWMWTFFKRICLIRKLRETRVLAGFTRLLPLGTDDVDAPEIQPLSRNTSIGWLPAMIVRGEGVFIEFNSESVNEWERQPYIEERIDKLMLSVNKSRLERGLSHELLTPKFVLLHTFAHILIRQLSYDCGYGSASLRERIYCDLEDSSNEMHGILIYTAAGDSEGTMGGLVRQGEKGNIEKTIHGAISSSMWCSSDPVCMESTGQGTSNSNIAACHACALLPETSCEKGNRLLDRGVLVDKEYGYFKQIIS